MSSLSVEISVVSPVYQAEACLGDLHRRLTQVLDQLTEAYEIILVDDCSTDSSWQRIQELAARDQRVRGVRLSRNFGQYLAIAAGLSESRGEQVVVMDCDLQDPPEMIPSLVQKAREGFDVVSTIRESRADSIFRRVTSRFLYFLTRILSSPYVIADSNTLSLISRKVVSAYLEAADPYSPYPFILNWLGFRSAVVELKHAERAAGTSAYTLGRLISNTLNILVSQSTRLLHLSTGIGLFFSLLAVVFIFYVVYLKLSQTTAILGWTSLMAVILLVGGSILFSLGVIGLYLTRMFEQTRNRPLFIVSESTNDSATSCPKPSYRTAL